MRFAKAILLAVTVLLASTVRAAQGPVEIAETTSAAESFGTIDLPESAAGFRVVDGRTFLVFAEPATDPETPRSAAPPVAPRPLALATTGRADIDRLARAAAVRHRVDPTLVTCVMRQESGFNPRAVSSAGACGLMQLMPATARRFGVTDIFDPAQNVDAGVRYLRFLLDLFEGDVSLALAGYNAGEGRVLAAGRRIPAITETREYVVAILARYRALGRDATDLVQSQATCC